MLRIVLPVAVAVAAIAIAPIAIVDIVPVAAVDVVAVAVVDEVVVVIDVHIVVATPSGAVTPSAAPHRSHRHSYAKRDRHAGRVISGRRISDWGVGINGRSVHYGWVVARNVHNLRIRLLNHDHLFALDNLGFNLLLFRGLQVAGVLGFLSHALHCVHHIVLLRKKGIS